MRPALCCLAIALCTPLFAADPREVFYQGPLKPNNITPTYDKGYLLVHNYPAIDVYTPDGSPLAHVIPQVSGSQFTQILNAAADTDGTLAGAVEYHKNSQQGGGLALFDSTGRQTAFFDTPGYQPTQVAFAEDHSLWTLGWSGHIGTSPDLPLLRNYSQQGEARGAFLPRSTFRSDVEPVSPCVGCIQLRIVGQRVEALFFQTSILKPGQSLQPAQWVELDLQGKELGRWVVGDTSLVAVFSSAANLYTQHSGNLETFDRAAKAWRRVSPSPEGDLLGADGADLVYWKSSSNVLRRVADAAR